MVVTSNTSCQLILLPIMSKEVEVEFQELGDLGGLDGEVSGEIRIPLMDSEVDDGEGSTLDEPVWTTLVRSYVPHDQYSVAKIM